jgi:hypothetical protein
MGNNREEVWIVYYRRYSSDQWSAAVFPTKVRAETFARNKYEAEESAAQTRVKHYVEVRPALPE